MKPLETLTKARELLSDPKRWAKKHWALNAQGERCKYGAPEAVCWCLAGALAHCIPGTGDDAEQAYDDAYTAVLETLRAVEPDYIHTFVAWNDVPERTHGEVLALLDKAIERVANP